MDVRALIVAALTSVVGGAAACGARSPLPIGETLVDASTLDDASTVDALAPSGTSVRGHVTAHHTMDSGPIDRGVDLSQVAIDLFAERADGSFATIHGVGSANGDFSVASVPDGPFQLRIGSTVLVHPSSRDLSLSLYVAGRPDAATSSFDDFNAQLDVDNLSPWQAPPPIFPFLVFSSNAGCEGDINEFHTNAPMAGDTSITGANVVMQLSGTTIDAARGDKAILAQFAEQTTQDGTRTRQLVGMLDIASPELRPSAPPFDIRGSFQGLVASWAVNVSWDTTRFGALAPQLGPGMKPSIATASVGAWLIGPAPEDTPLRTLAPNRISEVALPLANVVVDATTAPPQRLAYAMPSIPMANLWVVGSFQFAASTPIEDGHGGMTMFNLFASFQQLIPMHSFEFKPFEPVLTPPSNIRINGVDAFGGPRGVGVAPVFTWDATTAFDPKFVTSGGSIVYDLEITRLVPDPNFDSGVSDGPDTTTFRSTEPHVAFPPGIVTAGQTYSVRLTAQAFSGGPNPFAYAVVGVNVPPFSP